MTRYHRWIPTLLVLTISLLIWGVLHIPAVKYGTDNLALHQSYVGDEQSPVNGALHVLADRNILAFRNLSTLYYGPVFAVVAIPAVGLDFVEKTIRGIAPNPEAYKNYILRDWGGIVWKARLISVTVGFFGLVAVYALLMTRTINPTRNRMLAVVGTLLLATNFYYFEYASFFRHWIYLVTGLLIQLYYAVRMYEDPEHSRKYLAIQALLFFMTFGISYVSAFTQVLFLPILISWLQESRWRELRQFVWYAFVLLFVVGVIVMWHPHAFYRLIGVVGGDAINADTSAFTSEVQAVGTSFVYYARILLLNHVVLCMFWALCFWGAWRQRLLTQAVWWVPVIPAVFWYLMFGYISHHESRYALPIIVLLYVSGSMLWVRIYPTLPAIHRWAGWTLVGFTIIFHVMSIVLWTNLMIKGPPEKQAIAEAVAYQQAHPEARQLFVQYYLVGHPHTNEAYRDYMDRFGKSEVNLYKVLLETPVPERITPLNVFYVRPDERPSLEEMFVNFDRVLYLLYPTEFSDIEPDYLEVNLMRLWFPNVVQNIYVLLKES